MGLVKGKYVVVHMLEGLPEEAQVYDTADEAIETAEATVEAGLGDGLEIFVFDGTRVLFNSNEDDDGYDDDDNDGDYDGGNEFELTPKASTRGTSGQGHVELSPIKLARAFGDPLGPSLDGKVSGRYIFTDEDGNVVTLYDWKQTTLHHGEDSFESTPEEFWDSEQQEEFNIGAKSKDVADRFEEWVTEKVEE